MPMKKCREAQPLLEPGVVKITVDAKGITRCCIRGMADIEDGRPMTEDTI